jgi:hypothetical protein
LGFILWNCEYFPWWKKSRANLPMNLWACSNLLTSAASFLNCYINQMYMHRMPIKNAISRTKLMRIFDQAQTHYLHVLFLWNP